MIANYSYQLSKSFGYLRLPEVDFLKDICRQIEAENPRMINIGIGAATSLYTMYEQRPDAEIIAVDIDKQVGLSQLQEGGLTPYIRLVYGDSKEVGKTWSLPIDLLFIDGDHSYEGCYGDLTSWIPHLVESGVVVCHDYNGEFWPQVTQAVDTVMADWHRIGLVETLIAFSRNGTYWQQEAI